MRKDPIIVLESPDRDSGWSFSGTPIHSLVCEEGEHSSPRTTLREGDTTIRQWDEPLDALKWMASNDAFSDPDQRWVGFLSYDIGRWFERLPNRAADDLRLPAFRFDRLDKRVVSQPCCNVNELRAAVLPGSELSSTFSRLDYLQAVRRAKDYVAAGDLFQVNLSQRLSVHCSDSATKVFAYLQRDYPADFAALLDYGGFAIVSNSPELFFRVEQIGERRRIVNRPIKGTRPRIPGMDLELRDSLKDQAELNMIVDLQRNDLGRVCEIGSVKVTQPREIEAHPTVYHGVATIEGFLRPDVDFVDLLRAIFPCGSITGCPKIRAMEIIDELEPVRRGPYCGAIGSIAANGDMTFSVAIRTMILKNGLAYVPVGGGIVADSDPAAEFDETWVKAGAILRALGCSVPKPIAD